jgi:hypothetical protein
VLPKTLESPKSVACQQHHPLSSPRENLSEILSRLLCLEKIPPHVLKPSRDERILEQFWYSPSAPRLSPPASTHFTGTYGTWRNTRCTTTLLLKQLLGTTIKLFDFNWLVFPCSREIAVPEDQILEGKYFVFNWLVRLAGFEPATCCSGGEWLQLTQFTIPFPHIHLHVFGDSAFARS